MGKISLSTNVDLQNYSGRIEAISKAMRPLGIEIFSLPQNYANRYLLELPEKSDARPQTLNKELAKDIGRRMKESGIKNVQYHYPWQKTLLDMEGHDIALTYEFCDIIKDESGAEQMTINHHCCMKYPAPSVTDRLDGEYRKLMLGMLDFQSRAAQNIMKSVGADCLLIVENNPSVSIDYDKKSGEGLLDNADLVPEDFIERTGIEGITFDYAHGWSVVNALGNRLTGEKGKQKFSNLEWCKRQYGGVPEHAKSVESFVRKVAPKIKWVHISDEDDAFGHNGRHIGEGSIGMEECAELLEKYLTKETPATIEVKDGYTDAGLKKILEHDYPVLKKLFG